MQYSITSKPPGLGTSIYQRPCSWLVDQELHILVGLWIILGTHNISTEAINKLAREERRHSTGIVIISESEDNCWQSNNWNYRNIFKICSSKVRYWSASIYEHLSAVSVRSIALTCSRGTYSWTCLEMQILTNWRARRGSRWGPATFNSSRA